jgi:hypothetical protein
MGFLLWGGILRFRLLRLRRTPGRDLAMLEVTSAFALVVGLFLLALTIMSGS